MAAFCQFVHRLVPVFVAILICGCASDPSPGSSPPTSESSLIDRVRSGAPQRIGPFVRTEIQQYDQAGNDVSVGYNYFDERTSQTLIAFTAYFAPLPPAADRALDRYLGDCVAEVKRAHADAQLVNERAKVIELKRDGKRYAGRLVSFRFSENFGGLERRQALVSEMWLFDDTPRVVKYRISYPQQRADEARKLLADFIPHFPWPAK